MIARSDASFTPVLELECKLQVVEVQVRKDRVEGVLKIYTNLYNNNEQIDNQ